MEIGSEFWENEENLNCNNQEFWNIGVDTKFTLSGRTAIYFILKNILLHQNINKVYMPSYCCDSMIKPFQDLGIEIDYYEVYYDNGLKYNIDFNNDSEIFFAMNYFGYSESNMDIYIKEFNNKGKLIIEDITHSILSKKSHSRYSHYLVGSLRKWFPIASGGIAVNLNGKFDLKLSTQTNEKIIHLKENAMENKKKYINDENKNIVDKEMFLKQYSESNTLLLDEYKDYSIDNQSLKIIMKIDLEKIKSVRRENVKKIYEKLKNNFNITFLFEEYNREDVLLFVPLMLDEDLRNNLRNFLIEKNIYLPIHWPQKNKLNSIFSREISLVCDQRYTVGDIEKYVQIILEFLS